MTAEDEKHPLKEGLNSHNDQHGEDQETTEKAENLTKPVLTESESLNLLNQNKADIEKSLASIDKRDILSKLTVFLMAMFSKIDILVNNAATKTSDVPAFFASFEDYALETWSEVMSVNVDGMFLMAQAVGKHMVSSGGGTIVQVASIYGLVGPDQRIYEGSNYLGGPINTPAVYSASKAAVVGLTKWLSTYWADKGIRVNCIVPGGVSSGQNEVFENNYSSRVPMGRMAREDELVPALIYLSSDASSYVTGHVLSVDGGWTAW